MSFGTLKTVTIEREGVMVDINETDLKDTDVVITDEMTQAAETKAYKAAETEAYKMNAKPKPKR